MCPGFATLHHAGIASVALMRDGLPMKLLINILLLTGLSIPALAVDKAQLDSGIRKLTAKFEALQAKADKRIPAQNLRKAQGIVLLDRTKAGFLFAYQGGGGVAMVKDPKSGQWSAPAFLKANEASLGFQVGGQQSFVVILLLNTNATRMLTEPTFNFGGEASGTAGTASGGAEGTVSSEEQLMQVYSDSEGLYGGVAVKGGSVSPDTDANVAYYDQALTAKEILFENKAKPGEAATQLAKKIKESSSK
jgi:lipid-binding SYLF domain-containing protein